MQADPDTFVSTGHLFYCRQCRHLTFTTYDAAYDHIAHDDRHEDYMTAIRLRYGSSGEAHHIASSIKVYLIPDKATEIRIIALASSQRTNSPSATLGVGASQALSIRNHNDNYKYNVQIVAGNVPAPAIPGSVAPAALLNTRVTIVAPHKYGLGPIVGGYCFLLSLDLAERAPTRAGVLAHIASRFKTDWVEQHPGNDTPPPEVGWASAAARCFLGINTLAVDLEVRFKLRNDGEVEKFYKAGREEAGQDSMWALVMGG